MANAREHQPVLLEESLSHLHLHPGAVVIDGTLGAGGHASAILDRTAPDGILIGLDLDREALSFAARRLAAYGDRVQTVHASFRSLGRVLEDLDIEQVDGVLLDLGMSSRQLDAPERGFRFAEATADETPLDMRLDDSDGATAGELLRRASAQDLERWLREYGELRGARRLARTIVEQRQSAPFETAADLVRAVREARVGGGRKHHPATLVFQALRIAVNDELGALREGLDAAIAALRPGGHLVVLAYHSLEDRIVKHTFRAEARGCICPPDIPVCVCGHLPRLRVSTRRPVMPGEEELARNPRARSARLRAAERIEEVAA